MRERAQAPRRDSQTPAPPHPADIVVGRRLHGLGCACEALLWHRPLPPI